MFAQILNPSEGSREIQKALNATTAKRPIAKETQSQSKSQNVAKPAEKIGSKKRWHLEASGSSLRRWIPESAEKKIEVKGEVKKLTFNDEEYRTLIAPLKSSDKWTKQETEYLVELVQRHNIIWPVILDKYQWPPRKPPPDMGDAEEVSTEEEEPRPPPTRDLVDLKDRWYSVCQAIVNKQPSAEVDTKKPANTKYIFDPKGEVARRKLAESRFEVNSFAADREEKLRNLLSVLQELSKKLEKEVSHETVPKELPIEPGLLLDTTADGAKFADTELKRLERDLLPLRNVVDGLYKSKGATLASQLIKQSGDIFSLCVHVPKKSANSGGASTLSSRGANTPAGVNELHHAKEVSEGIEKILKAACKDLPTGLDQPDPKTYFLQTLQRFTPPIATRQSLEAYTDLRLDAAVCYQLRKQHDHLDSMHDKWVNKLSEVRKNLRTARRAVAKAVPSTKASDATRWRSASSSGLRPA